MYVEGNRPIERGRVTIPLANIASTRVQSGTVVVQIKPTAAQVMVDRKHSPLYRHWGRPSYTHTVSFKYVQDAGATAEVIKRKRNVQ